MDAPFGLYWQNAVFCLASVCTVPLYILLVWTIVGRRRTDPRYQTTYYHLVLTQALADFVAIPSETFAFILRRMGAFHDFYWDYRSFTAPYGYNSNHYFMLLRVFGDWLISMQRFIVLCYPSSKAFRALAALPFFAVVLIHWIPPFFFTLPILINFNKTFDNPVNLLFVLDPSHQMMSSCIQVGYQLAMFSTSLIAYTSVFRLIWVHRSTRITVEMRLSLVVIGQSLAFAMALLFYTTQFVVVVMKIPDGMLWIRDFYPLMTGLESYCNPWLHLLLNSDLRREMFKVLRFRRIGSVVTATDTRSNSRGPVHQ